MQLIDKEQFEDILYNPNISVSEKRSFERSSVRGKRQVVTKLISNDGSILAMREVTPEGNFYYKVGEVR